MLIIFDQATPVPIRAFLAGHTVRTAAQQGWDKLRNGDLLTVAEKAGFDVLVTTDKNNALSAKFCGPENRDRCAGPAAMAATSVPR